MTRNERNMAIRDGLLQALAMVQSYQKKNGKRLRVSDVCRDIKRLINEEAAYMHWHAKKYFPSRPGSSAANPTRPRGGRGRRALDLRDAGRA
jgi:hypothetical protein